MARRPARRRADKTPPPSPAGPAPGDRAKSVAAAVVMCALVVAVYFPVRSQPDENTLFASDFHQLHSRRIHFAQQAISTTGHLPAWYSRELMGTPFWSNVQNFPFIPTRLVLLWMDPLDLITAGVLLAAVLAALFTFAFSRSVGVGRVGAATAGWTFACAGFFASRVMAGHLPLLEAYPALPLLLWRVEMCLGERHVGTDRRVAVRLAILALSTCCVMLAGHPQLPVYAVGVAGLYALYRGWRRQRLPMSRAVAAMALGAGCAAFALWPMFQLVGRSTRVLPLEPAANDLPMPYGRLLALLFPWRDGWPEQVLARSPNPFGGYVGGENVFWDTVCYVGWLPLVSAALLGVRQVARRRLPAGPWMFIAAVGVLALLASLPAAQQIGRLMPGTILRSPARLLYVTTFALSIGTGVAIGSLARRPLGPVLVLALVIPLAAHLVDLTAHDRAFVRMTHVATLRDPPFENAVRQFAGDGRVGMDFSMTLPLNREIDDVGFFESIMLAKAYAALADLSGVPPTTNVQYVDGGELPPRALASTATRLVITTKYDRPDLRLVSGVSKLRSYAVPGALSRAAFYPGASVHRVDVNEIHRRLRDPSYDVGSGVMLDRSASTAEDVSPTTSPAVTTAAPVAYQRPSTDEIVLRVQPPVPGVLRVLETWDPGWRATIDGAPADVLCADDVFLAVALPPGAHEVKFTYSTPGVTTGLSISVASLCLLAALAAFTARGNHVGVKIDKHSG